MAIKVGWREWVSLPEIGIAALKCKVDTGAKHSALHAFEVKPFEKRGEQWVRFYIHTDEKDLSQIQVCESKIIDIRSVTDSSGNCCERFFIETVLEIGAYRYPIKLSLTDRDSMKYNMLLGRTALRTGKFTVDSRHSFLQGKRP